MTREYARDQRRRGRLFIVDLRDWKEVQLFARFGYGEQRWGVKSGLDAGAGKGCKVTPPGQVWLSVKSTSEIIIFIIREFAESAPESYTGEKERRRKMVD